MKGKGHVKSDSYLQEFDLNDEKAMIKDMHIQAFTIKHKNLKKYFSKIYH